MSELAIATSSPATLEQFRCVPLRVWLRHDGCGERHAEARRQAGPCGTGSSARNQKSIAGVVCIDCPIGAAHRKGERPKAWPNGAPIETLVRELPKAPLVPLSKKRTAPPAPPRPSWMPPVGAPPTKPQLRVVQSDAEPTTHRSRHVGPELRPEGNVSLEQPGGAPAAATDASPARERAEGQTASGLTHDVTSRERPALTSPAVKAGVGIAGRGRLPGERLALPVGASAVSNRAGSSPVGGRRLHHGAQRAREEGSMPAAKMIEWKGQSKSASEWARELGDITTTGVLYRDKTGKYPDGSVRDEASASRRPRKPRAASEAASPPLPSPTTSPIAFIARVGLAHELLLDTPKGWTVFFPRGES
jgi:hypothetical protein